MYTDDGLLDEVLKKDNPNAKWLSPEHRAKAVSIILYNRRIDKIETLIDIVKAVNRIPIAVLPNITWYDLNMVYGCPRVW